MMPMDIHKIIEDFIDLIEHGRGSVTANEAALALELDRLALAMHAIEPVCDGRDYPDPPECSYEQLYQHIGELFSRYGYYNLAADISEKVGEATVTVGDAIDDLTDIALELYEVHWRWCHTSANDAIWYLNLSYHAHWGMHLRALQLYLFAKEREG